MKNSLKIFAGFHNITGYYHVLQKGFANKGVRCDVFDLTQNESFYKFNKFPSYIGNVIIELNYLKRKLKKHFFIFAIPLHFIEKSLIAIFFFECLLKYNVFIFSYASTFFFYKDLLLLKLFNKKVIYIFHGSDARPPYLSGRFYVELNGGSSKQIYKRTKFIKNRIKFIERYSDHIISSIFIGQFFTKPFLNWYQIGIPLIPQNVAHKKSTNPDKTFTILHSPSFPLIKGSQKIIETIDSLKNDGYNINLKILTKVQNKEVLIAIQDADLVVDQLYSECFWSVFAMEAILNRTPALVCGNAPSELVDEHLPGPLKNAFYVQIDDFKVTLKNILDKKLDRKEIDKTHKLYIEKMWHFEKVAERFIKMLCNDLSSDWYVDPNTIGYIHGGACRLEWIREMVLALIKKYGESSLQLDDKLNLKKTLLRLIKPNISS